MILAAIVLVSIFCPAPASARADIAVVPDEPQLSNSRISGIQGESSSQDSNQKQNNSGTPATQTTTNPTTQGAPPSNPAPKHRRHKKKAAIPPECPTSVPAGSAAAKKAQSANTTATGTLPTNCPPPKIVVRNGSTADPAVHITGGEGGEDASHDRATTDQLLESTGENLKKLDGRSLDASQQEMVHQIQQFMDQAKAAVASGELERSHNLAMKADLLSDELLKP